MVPHEPQTRLRASNALTGAFWTCVTPRRRIRWLVLGAVAGIPDSQHHGGVFRVPPDLQSGLPCAMRCPMVRRLYDWLLSLCGYRRCRFCREVVRHGHGVHQLVNGVCHGCLAETVAWLDEIGATICWPMP